MATAGLVADLPDAWAQDSSGATPPAEYPPSSYPGKQYVDSRGCIYIRAEIDGTVSWVPRVSRDRSQICGYKPTVVAGTTKTPPGAAEAPGVSPEPEDGQPARTATAITTEQPESPAAENPEQVPSTTAAPQSEAVVEAPPESAATPEPQPTAPQTAAMTTEPEQQPTAKAATTASASVAAGSKPKRATPTTRSRAKPVAAPARTVTVVPVAGGKAQPAVELSQSIRVVPRHVYENRQHVKSVKIPRGYRAAWDDDRLNLRRAERTLAPSNVQGTVTIPRGYQVVDREDDRFNSRRGSRTPEGDAQTMLIWTNEVPMRLIRVPANRPVIRVDEAATKSAAEANYNGTFRVSTQSAPKQTVQYDR